VKRSITITCLFFLIVASITLFPPSDAKADDQKIDLVSSMNLTAAGPMTKNGLSALSTAKEGRPLRDAAVSVSESVSTYMDCGKPVRHDLGSQVVTSDNRTVIGFHFILK
jgi:hypothetical protein